MKQKKKGVLLIFILICITVLILSFLITKSITGNAFFDFLNQDQQTEFITQNGYAYSFDDKDLTDNALIIYNENYLDGREIAEYYATRRGIPFNQICAVKLPLGQFADYTYFKSARKTVIEDCICNNIDLSKLSGACVQENIDNIVQISPFSHLVFIKGIPLQLYNTGWTGEGSGIPFETFFSVYLYNSNFEAVAPDITSDFFLYDGHNALYGYRDSISPERDKIAVHGRIEEITKERTFALIDRIIASEEEGLKGNLFTDTGGVSQVLPMYQTNIVLDDNSLCQEYYDNSATENWIEECRLGIARDGYGPGKPQSGISPAINTGLYFAYNPKYNGQKSFSSFPNMLNFRKTSNACTPLCKDLPTEIERNICVQNSLDYFKQINTDCVGGNNLLGLQIRSFTVQYFGFFPQGWEPLTGGNYEKTPSTIKQTGGFQNDLFTDTSYAFFGVENKKETPTCLNEGGVEELCEEHIFLNIKSSSYVSNELLIPIEPNKTRDVKIRFRYKNPQSNNNQKLRVQLFVQLENNALSNAPLNSSVILVPGDGNSWVEKELNIVINNTNNIKAKKIIVGFYTDINGYNLKNNFSLDGVEVYDTSTSQSLLQTNAGSFNEIPLIDTQPGGWATDAIARIGGIGWWGSMSHFITNGAAFPNKAAFFGTYFSGKSLGESIYYSGRNGVKGSGLSSGIIFADPLYRASGVKIFDESPSLNIGEKQSFVKQKIDDTMLDKVIKINAFHGSKNAHTVRWNLTTCEGTDERLCENNHLWKEFASGTGEVYESSIDTLATFKQVAVENNNNQLMLKLTVWNPGEEDQSLTNIAYLNFDFEPEDLTTCYSNSDCGSPYLSHLFCNRDTSVNAVTILPYCVNAGTLDSECREYQTSEVYEVCQYGCADASCLIDFDNELFMENSDSTIIEVPSYKELSDVSNFTVARTNKAKVQFLEPVNLAKDARNNALNISKLIHLEENYVSISSRQLTGINKPANITLFNLPFKNPQILRDGLLCEECSIISYKDNTLLFNVTRFSTYTTQEGCTANTQCGDVTYSDPYCDGSLVKQDTIAPICQNPATINSICTTQSVPQIVETCNYGCTAGVCNPECTTDSQCQTDYFSENYCSESNAVSKDLHYFSCVSNTCSESITSQFVSSCDYGCSNGMCDVECTLDTDCSADYYSQNYCQGNDLYRDFHDISCLSNTCSESTSETFVESCAYGCTNGACDVECNLDTDCTTDYLSEPYCVADDVYQMLHDFSCDLNSCSESTSETFIESCAYGCTNGACDVECNLDTDCTADYLSEPYCVADDVYQMLHDFSCDLNSCSESTSETFVESCAYGCTNGACDVECNLDTDCSENFDSTPYCLDNNLYKDVTTYACVTNSCGINVEQVLVEDCSQNCEEGACTTKSVPQSKRITIRYNQFKNETGTTNLTNKTYEELSNLSNVTFAKNNSGVVLFPGPINLSQNIINDTLNFDTSINISHNFVMINTSVLTSLKAKAFIILYNLTFTKPQILRDGAVCLNCSLLYYQNNTLIFNVSSFSTYTVRETPSTTGDNTDGNSNTNGGGSNRRSSGGGSSGSNYNTLPPVVEKEDLLTPQLDSTSQNALENNDALVLFEDNAALNIVDLLISYIFLVILIVSVLVIIILIRKNNQNNVDQSIFKS